jgi:pre-mRNA-splicing factor ATP-dependent RNA helicase DHX16
VQPSTSRSTKLKVESSDDEMEKQEADRLKDLHERDALSSRLRKKDREQTRHIAERSDKSAFEEAAKRIKLDEDSNRADVIAELREKSRVDYLQKREADKIDELQHYIRDEETIFRGERLVNIRMFYDNLLYSD